MMVTKNEHVKNHLLRFEPLQKAKMTSYRKKILVWGRPIFDFRARPIFDLYHDFTDVLWFYKVINPLNVKWSLHKVKDSINTTSS